MLFLIGSLLTAFFYVSVFKSATFFQALSTPLPLQDTLLIKLLKFYNVCFYVQISLRRWINGLFWDY